MRRHHLELLLACIALLVAMLMTAPAAQQPTRQPPPQQPAAQTPATRPATTAGAMKIDLDELEKHPEKFLGKTVTVEGEIDRVLGPNLFTIDERDWVDADREMAVVVPEPFAAIVRSDVPVRVTGTVEKMPIAKIAHGVFNDQKIKAEIETQPVLVASDIVATQSGVNLRVQVDKPDTSGATGQPLTDVNEVAKGNDKNLVGKRVDLNGVMITSVGHEGFWVRTPSGERIFVLTKGKPGVKEGQQAEVKGVVLELPEGLKVQVNAGNESIYILADSVRPRA
jgi:hypothetical protein